MRTLKAVSPKLLVKISVSAVLLVVLFRLVDKGAILRSLAELKPSYVPLMFILVFLNYLISSFRWKRLVSIFPGEEKVSVMRLFRLYFIGAFFNNFLPTSIGGDVYKAMKLGSMIGSRSHAFAATLTERFSGVVVLTVLSAFGLISSFGTLGVLAVLLFFVGLAVGLKTIKFIGEKIPKVKKFSDAILTYRARRDVLYFALFTSVFVQLFSILTQYFIFVALGYNIPLGFSLFVFPVIILASFFIPSQNSFGVQDFLYATFFTQVGIPIEASVSASIVYHAVRLISSLLGGIFYAVER